MAISPHDYKGNLTVCLTCFRPKDDSIHTVMPLGIHTVKVKEPDLSNSNLVPDIAIFNQFDSEYLKNIDPESDPGEMPEENAVFLVPKEVKTQEKQETITCDGHKCPKCQVTWYHDYDCQGKKVSGLCKNCAGGIAVEINRPTEIEQLAQTSSTNLTGHEVAAAMLQHESFLVNNLIYEFKPDGQQVERPDWQERINAHRRDLKRKIELFRVQEIATSKVLLAKQIEDVGKLTPEEIEQYKRDARKIAAGGAKKTAAATKEPKKLDAKEAYEKMIGNLVKEIRTKKPNLTPDEVVIRAKRQYEILNAEEDGE